MTRPGDERPQLDRAEEQFVARLATHYAPTPMTPAKRVAWDEALWTRLRQRPRRALLTPALTTAAVAVVVAWLTWPRLFTPVPRGEWGGAPLSRVVETPSLGQWASELLYPRELTGLTERDDSAILPDDYRVIAQVFLDGQQDYPDEDSGLPVLTSAPASKGSRR